MSEKKLKLVITGHIDHGKSTLIGRLMYEAGGLSEDVREELEKSEFAHFTDHLEEERLEEKTIDTAQAFFKSGDRQYVIIDTPGHKEFLKNMLTGASQADAAILIVSAFEGIEEQTKRHAYLLKLLGIKQIIIAVNKMDRVDYDEAKFKQTKKDILDFLATLKVPVFNVIPISARRGDNISVPSVNMNWYSGVTVLEALDEFHPAHDPVEAPFRMPVQGIFKVDGKTVVLGRIAAGKVKPGERVTIMPGELEGEVSSIEVFGQDKREAVAGESVGLVLDNGAGAARGQVISEVDDLPRPGKKLDAHLFWMDEKPLSLKESLTIKCATAEIPCKVEKIGERLNSSSLEVIGHDADRLEEAEAGTVTIALSEPLVFEDFTAVPELGRFVLQRAGRVCAGGVISAA
jgi:translation elongation factor TU